mmetsp:Transcript_3557/g.10019  ORF Transcript_3557/g.10019 Transcript_3557/m.10019 type:complete len:302 (+) Transcript_3557:2945-3850(+)
MLVKNTPDLVLRHDGNNGLVYLSPHIVQLCLQRSSVLDAIKLSCFRLELASSLVRLRGQLASRGGDSPHALCNAFLRQNRKRLGLLCVRQMRASTKLNAVVVILRRLWILQQSINRLSDGNHSYRIGVSLPEDGAKAMDVLSILQRHFLVEDLQSLVDVPLDLLLNLAQFLGIHRLIVVEVKAKLLIVHKGTLLLHILTDVGSQSKVQQVRAGVIVGYLVASRVIDLDGARVSLACRALLQLSDMEDISRSRLRVHHLERSFSPVDLNDTTVSNLTSHLGVEGRCINDQGNDLVSLDLINE